MKLVKCIIFHCAWETEWSSLESYERSLRLISFLGCGLKIKLKIKDGWHLIFSIMADVGNPGCG